MSNDYLAWGWTPGAGLDGLHLLRKPLPTPGPGEVLVANRAIALNPVDWKIVEWGHAAWSQDHVPGVDGVGRVVATGAGCDLALGSRVAYHQWLGRDGSFAEYTLLDADALLALPGGLDEARAAALPCPALTAWQALEKVPGGGPRDVLVVGAGGAVGLFLAQLAVRRGWRVWATAATEHREPLLGLGVLGVFDYRRADWRSVSVSVRCSPCSIPSAASTPRAWPPCSATTATWSASRTAWKAPRCRPSARRSRCTRWLSTASTAMPPPLD
nr:alcohol dehydrogenase catalytic domain-containing protein [Pseudomonas aeruginosa]